ncbi:dockerin type I domain-containing protein, partial [bacterium]|nr:dockerin type I domain-containing protein [bacterium]
DAIRIERMDDSAAIPLGSVPGDAMIILNHNDAIAEDTNLDGTVTALDALLVINDTSSGVVSGEAMSSPSEEIRLTDVNADGYVTALDALTVLNAISRSSVLEGEASVLGPEVFGPEVLGPEELGPEELGPEELRLGVSVLPGGSVVDEDEYWARCLEEIDWDAEEDAMMDLGASSGTELDSSASTSWDASTTDAVFGSDRTGRPANALTEDRLDEFFSDLDHDLAAEER